GRNPDAVSSAMLHQGNFNEDLLLLALLFRSCAISAIPETGPQSRQIGSPDREVWECNKKGTEPREGPHKTLRAIPDFPPIQTAMPALDTRRRRCPHRKARRGDLRRGGSQINRVGLRLPGFP